MLKKYEKVLEQDYRSWYKTAEAYRKRWQRIRTDSISI